MDQVEQLLVLMKAAYRICKVLNMDEKAQSLLCAKSINAKLKSQFGGNDDSQISLVTHVKQSLIEFAYFYCALHDLSAGDTAFMNHWLGVKNKSFGVPPRELLSTCEGIQRLNRYFDELNAIKY